MSLIYKGQTIADVGGSGSSAGSSEEVYSTEETRIGTWIDGKPIYKRSAIYAPLTLTDDRDTVSFPNHETIDRFVNHESSVVSGAYRFSGILEPAIITNKGFTLLGKYGAATYEKAYLTVYYTKTTDQVPS